MKHLVQARGQNIHDGHIFSNVDFEIKILEHIHSTPRWVAESDILESERPRTRRIKYHAFSRLDCRGSVEELKNTRPGANSTHYRGLEMRRSSDLKP
jgi:hypothetical protein